MELSNTGEQYIPELSSVRLKQEHLARYEFAANVSRGKDVLDVACGSGYGTELLARAAANVCGLDRSSEAIQYAVARYQRPNLSFVQGDCTVLPQADASLDLVVSFETLEHLEQQQRRAFLSEIRRVLKPDGQLILSTPNKRVTSPDTDKPLNRFHVLEFTRQTLQTELNPYFEVLEWNGQRQIRSFWVVRPVRLLVRILEKVFGRDFGVYSTRSSAKISAWKKGCQPRIIIVRCKPHE